MVGFTLLSRSYYYSCVDEVPAPPFPPDHRQAGERRAITRQLVLYTGIPLATSIPAQGEAHTHTYTYTRDGTGAQGAGPGGRFLFFNFRCPPPVSVYFNFVPPRYGDIGTWTYRRATER